jgi:hypothetical protein
MRVSVCNCTFSQSNIYIYICVHACKLFTRTPLHFSWHMYSSSHISSYINKIKCLIIICFKSLSLR